jgi:hypothetical protein
LARQRAVSPYPSYILFRIDPAPYETSSDCDAGSVPQSGGTGPRTLRREGVCVTVARVCTRAAAETVIGS